MSTRATYQFVGDNYPAPITLYIHHDGYPEGAADYFYDAIEASGDLTHTSMMSTNPRAEITESHEIHGDTQYRYTINGDNLIAYKRAGFSDNWNVFYAGPIRPFMDQYYQNRAA